MCSHIKETFPQSSHFCHCVVLEKSKVSLKLNAGSFLQVPTPITSMDISVKRVSWYDYKNLIQCSCFLVQTSYYCMFIMPYCCFLLLYTASPVCGLSIGCGTGEDASLWDLWKSLCWVLLGKRPLLCLGWIILYSIHIQQQTPLPEARHQARKPCAAVFGSESEW